MSAKTYVGKFVVVYDRRIYFNGFIKNVAN